MHWARAYADQTEADHAVLVAAVKAGRLPYEPGVWALVVVGAPCWGRRSQIPIRGCVN